MKIHFGFDVNIRESKNEAFFSTRTGKNYISHVERALAQVEDVLYYIDDKYDEDRRRELQLIEATGRKIRNFCCFLSCCNYECITVFCCSKKILTNITFLLSFLQNQQQLSLE